MVIVIKQFDVLFFDKISLHLSRFWSSISNILAFQVHKKITVGSQRHNSVIDIHQVQWILGVHLSGQMLNLTGISGIFKQHHIMGVQTHGALVFTLVKHILHHCNHGHISVVTSSGRHFCHFTPQLAHHIV